MQTKALEEQFKRTKTTLQIEQLMIKIFEDEGFERSRKGFADFEGYLSQNIRNYIVSSMNKGIIEILEDYYNI